MEGPLAVHKGILVEKDASLIQEAAIASLWKISRKTE